MANPSVKLIKSRNVNGKCAFGGEIQPNRLIYKSINSKREEKWLKKKSVRSWSRWLLLERFSEHSRKDTVTVEDVSSVSLCRLSTIWSVQEPSTSGQLWIFSACYAFAPMSRVWLWPWSFSSRMADLEGKTCSRVKSWAALSCIYFKLRGCLRAGWPPWMESISVYIFCLLGDIWTCYSTLVLETPPWTMHSWCCSMLKSCGFAWSRTVLISSSLADISIFQGQWCDNRALPPGW